MLLLPVLDLSEFDPEHLPADLEKAKSWCSGEEDPYGGWRKNKKGVTLLPEHLVEPVMKHWYETTRYKGFFNHLYQPGSQVPEFLSPCEK